MIDARAPAMRKIDERAAEHQMALKDLGVYCNCTIGEKTICRLVLI